MKTDMPKNPLPEDGGAVVGHDSEEIPVKIYDYAKACRRELERLESAQTEAVDRYQAVRETVARLESLATAVHPLLSEKIRRLVAIVRRLGESPAHSVQDRYQLLYSRLEEIQDSPLWALPLPAAAAARPPAETGPVLKPGAIYPDRVVLYTLGDLHFMVRGVLKYNLHRADLSREYHVRRGGPVLPVFPNPDRDSQAFPAPSYGGNLMVFDSPVQGEGNHIGLRYDRILGIEDFQHQRHERGMEILHGEHPVVAGRIARAGVDYYIIRL